VRARAVHTVALAHTAAPRPTSTAAEAVEVNPNAWPIVVRCPSEARTGCDANSAAAGAARAKTVTRGEKDVMAPFQHLARRELITARANRLILAAGLTN